jgi:hypothetical protein
MLARSDNLLKLGQDVCYTFGALKHGGWGYEERATVYPSNFSYTGYEVWIYRDVDVKYWNGSTQITTGVSTSGPDDNPANRALSNVPDSGGVIYGWDIPAIMSSDVDDHGDGAILHQRANFQIKGMLHDMSDSPERTYDQQYNVVISDISSVYKFYLAQSYVQHGKYSDGNYSVDTSMNGMGDNSIAIGSVGKLSYDLN